MKASMGRYTSLFEEAAQVVEATPQYPGQTIPGFWETSDTTSWAVLIGVIMGNAIAQVCRSRGDCVFEHAMARLMDVTKDASMTFKGDPAQIAVTRLRMAAQFNEDRMMSSVDRLRKLASTAAGFLEAYVANQDLDKDALVNLAKDIRATVGDAERVTK